MCWPELTLYDRQVEILYSLRDNDETIVPAGNALGKDFVTAFAVLWFFCSRTPCRIVTSSVDQPQLKGVLWGEIRRFVATSRYPLPIQMNDLLIRQVIDGQVEPRSYLIGRVTAKGEGLLGHHIERTSDGVPRTLAVFDEASGIDQESYEATDTWAHRKLIIGNPYPCSNFFFKGVKAGDLHAPDGKRYYRKIIQIKAIHSPNIRLAEQQIEAGQAPTNEILVPGVADYITYQKRRILWDKVRQSVGLDAEFYLGAEVMLFPPDWLNRAEQLSGLIDSRRSKEKRTMGVDPGEGGDNTAWSICDAWGLLHQESFQTPDTAVIPGKTLALMREWQVRPENILFDRGGGGKQHVDLLRKQGYNVRTVGFGEAASDPFLDKRMKTSVERREIREQQYIYKNRRAEMYGLLRQRLDPATGSTFALPPQYTELRRQLAPIPLLYDAEGRLYLPPKDKKNPDSAEVTLKELLGCSPDEADSLVLAVFGLDRKARRAAAGAALF
jgi:hypothetical protein